MPSPRRAPLLWTVWLVTLVALGRLVASLWPEAPLALRPGFTAAVESLRTAQGSDSLIVIWPPSQSDALHALPTDLVATDAVPLETEDLRQYLRITVLGPTGFDAPPELRGASAEPRQRFEDVEVGSFVYPSQDRILFDLRTSIAEAKVGVHGPQANVECSTKRADQGWDCPGQPPWNNVSPTTLKVDGHDWPCVWAHPFGGHELVIDIGERLLGDRVELEAALSDDAVSTQNGSSVITRSNGPGILRDGLATPRGRRARVQLIITAGSDGRRHLGVSLRLVESRQTPIVSGRLD